MSTGVALAVLFAALLHASWNALIKGGREPLLDTALLVGGASVMLAPGLLLVDPPTREQWPFIAASSAIHFGYYFALANTYRHGDLSLGYPLMRGTAPLLVALLGVVLLADQPSALAWAGIVCVSAGVISLAMRAMPFVAAAAAQSSSAGRPASNRPAANSRAAITFALLNACIIAAYSLVDASGVRQAGSTLSYVLWLFTVKGALFFLLIALLQREALLETVRRRWHLGLAGGLASTASYGIALWAMTQAPVGPVVAMRETSVVFAALIGVVFLHEKLTRARCLGIALVVVGVVLIKQ